MELKPISISQYKNFDNYGFMNTQTKEVPKTNFSPALIRMEYLENKVRDIENKNRAEMENSLKEINNKYIDPRFKKFLDNNQGKYDVFGNDIDPLDQRRVLVQNNLDNMRNKLDMEERKERRKKRKKEKKLNKKKKKKNFFADSEESINEEEEQNDEGNAFLNADKNNEDINNITSLENKASSKQISPALTRMSSKDKNTLGGGLRRKSLLSTLNKTIGKTQSKIGTKRNSIVSKKNPEKSTIETKESKEVKPIKEVKVCGDIGYSFVGKNKKEKEL